MKVSGNSFCPCCSKKKYKHCCRIFHYGENPKSALEVMKSRYSAFASNNSLYIIDTTHLDNSDFTQDIKAWEEDIHNFFKQSDFRKLEILDFIDGADESYVTFKAIIFQAGIDVSIIEKSKFLKVNNQWLYHSGDFIK